MVEILAGHRVGREGQCLTIQEDSCQELASVVMEKISTEGISIEVQLKKCSVKLFQTSSSLSFAKLSKLSSKHRATQSKQNLNWFSSKQTQWLSILSKNKQNKETPGQHSLTPSSRRSTPTRPNFHISGKEEAVAMENYAKRWQTREDTYQIKRPRLKPEVRDPPEYPSADIDMADI